MAVDVVTRLRGSTGLVATDVITRLRGGVAAGRKDVVTHLRGNSSTAVTVAFAPPLLTSVSPFETIALTVVPSDPTATIAVVQTAGQPVAINGTGTDLSVVAPALRAGTTLTFRVTASKTGLTSGTANYTIVVRPHGGLYRKTGAGVRITELSG